MTRWSLATHGTLGRLLIVNLLLQLFDGLASYYIISTGVPEANPLVASYIENWGVFGGLLFAKLLGCALVIFVFTLRHKAEIVVAQGLTVLAYLYSCLGVLLTIKLVLLFT